MAHAKLIWKGYKIKKALDNIKRAKINTERARQGLPPLRPWYEDCYINGLACLRETICLAFCPCCVYEAYRRNTRRKSSSSAFGRLFIDGTYENDILKHVLGFFFGLVMSTLFFFLMIYQLEYPWTVATPIAAVTGLILSIGMAFIMQVRCVVFLMLPQLFSSRGRAFLTTYIFVLVLGGPAKNFAHNVQVISASVTCGQSEIYNGTKEVVDAALSPVYNIIDAIKDVLMKLRGFANRLRESFTKMKKCFQEVVAAVGRAFAWLGNIVDVCNKNMSDPYLKCMASFNIAVANCRGMLGPMKFLCEIPNGFKGICNVARIGELLCQLTEKITSLVSTKINSNIKMAIHNVQEMFYFNVTLEYHYSHNLEQTRSYEEVRRDIMTQIKARLSMFATIIFWTNNLLIIMFIWLAVRIVVLLSAINYRRKYMKRDRFDNCYITFAIRDANERREEMGKETVLPLHRKESKKYIKPTSFHLAKAEKRKLITGLIFLAGSMIHAGFYLLIDYGAYWNLMNIRKHMHIKIHHDGKLIRESITSHLVPGHRVGLISSAAKRSKDHLLQTKWQTCAKHPPDPNVKVLNTHAESRRCWSVTYIFHFADGPTDKRYQRVGALLTCSWTPMNIFVSLIMVNAVLVAVPHNLQMHVEGGGFLAAVYSLLISAFDPLGRQKIQIDTTACLPNPSVPDWYLYKTVGVLYAVCLFLCLTEAYGLRLRHLICGCYYQRRDKERSVWLYNHILRKRGGFLKFLRRRLRHKTGNEEGLEEINCKDRCAANCCSCCRCARLFKWFGYDKKFCFSCGQPGKPEDKKNFKHCAKTDCNAIYCLDCFTDLNNMCTVCMDPIDYGDFSDFSEEVDSSDDDQVLRKIRCARKLRDREAYRGKRGETSGSEDSTDDESYRSDVTASESGAGSDRSGNYNYGHQKCKKELVSMNVYEGRSADYSDSDSDSDYSDWEYDMEPEYQEMERGETPVTKQPRTWR
ncbi:DC-STAMP domain-containing protein 2-like [Lineus longissimus]|uniref:DC-STAMP domain-containing protein 2-like n=1 Tax=Lineus longissimus TaxID=88925 RepID=UPI00315D70C8